MWCEAAVAPAEWKELHLRPSNRHRDRVHHHQRVRRLAAPRLIGMKAPGWLRVAAIAALLTVGCGAVTPTAAKSTPTPTTIGSSEPSPNPTNSPTPTASNRPIPKPTSKPIPVNPCPAIQPVPTTATNPNLVLVTLRGSGCVVVR